MAVYGFTDPGGERPVRQTVKSYESKVRSKPSGSPRGGKGRYASKGAINTAMQAAQYARDNNIGNYFSSSDDNRKYSPTSFRNLLESLKSKISSFSRDDILFVT